MAIDCGIPNRLIAIRPERLTGYWYQNAQIHVCAYIINIIPLFLIDCH